MQGHNEYGDSAWSDAVSVTTSAATSDVAITGTIPDGSTVSLLPASDGFGMFGGEVLQYSRGDEAANGTPISGVTPVMGADLSTFVIGGPSSDHLFFSNARARSGRSKSLRRSGDSIVDGTHRNGGFGLSGQDSTKLIISYWRYFSSDPNSVSNVNIKQNYVFSNGTDGSGISEKPLPILHVPAGTISWVLGPNMKGADSNLGNTAGWDLGADTEDQWQRWDFWLELNTADVSDGVANAWLNNTLGIKDETHAWQGSMQVDATRFKDVRIGYLDTGIDNALIDFSDVYIATTPARVELGNASS